MEKATHAKGLTLTSYLILVKGIQYRLNLLLPRLNQKVGSTAITLDPKSKKTGLGMRQRFRSCDGSFQTVSSRFPYP